MRYREQNNKNNRNWEIFEAGPDHIGKQGRVGSSLYRAQVRLPWVLGFLGFSGVARKLVEVLEIAEMPQEIAWETSGSCSGSLWETQEVLRGLGKGTELFRA